MKKISSILFAVLALYSLTACDSNGALQADELIHSDKGFTLSSIEDDNGKNEELENDLQKEDAEKDKVEKVESLPPCVRWTRYEELLSITVVLEVDDVKKKTDAKLEAEIKTNIADYIKYLQNVMKGGGIYSNGKTTKILQLIRELQVTFDTKADFRIAAVKRARELAEISSNPSTGDTVSYCSDNGSGTNPSAR